MNNVDVSVIIPCYNCESTIARTLESVFNQTFVPAEIILIDDVSTDNSKQIIEGIILANIKYNIKLLCLTENSGPGLARNEGWDKATKKWIAFLDADDIWHPKKIEIQYSYLELNDNVEVCGHNSMFFPNYKQDFFLLNVPKQTISFIGLLFKNKLPTRSVMLKRDLPYRFKDRFFTEDYLLWLEIAADRRNVKKLQDVLAYSLRPEFSPGGYSGQLWAHEKRELNAFRYLKEKRTISFFVYSFFCVFSLLKFLKRYIVIVVRKFKWQVYR